MKPKILQVHNRYLRPGGEDTVLAEEYDLLRENGHVVDQLFVQNEGGIPGGAMVALTGLKAVWSPDGYRTLSDALARLSPDIVHVHNTFPLLSPSIYWAAQRRGVPVVQTLHNYRLTCANGLLMRGGRPCEDCVGRLPLPALRYRCYKDSLAATSSLVAMQSVNRAIGTYRSKVDVYIALTEFARALMVRAGLPESRVVVKPNFLRDSQAAGPPAAPRKNQVVFVGRLDKEKGIDLLVAAWAALKPDTAKLVIIGDGPERAGLQEAAAGQSSIEWRGQVARKEVLAEIGSSRALALPSRWYEGFPMVLLEALCAGTPVLVPNLGAMPDLIGQGDAGLVFTGGDAASLQAALASALAWPEPAWRQKSDAARQRYLSRYTPEINYQQLSAIYDRVLSR